MPLKNSVSLPLSSAETSVFFRREPGEREKRIPNGSLCGGESLSFVTKEQLKTKL